MLFTHATSKALINNYTYVKHAYVLPTNTPLVGQDGEEEDASRIQRTRAYYEEEARSKKKESKLRGCIHIIFACCKATHVCGFMEPACSKKAIRMIKEGCFATRDIVYARG